MNESCTPFTAPQLASVVTVAKSADIGDAEAHFFAFHVSAGLHRGGALIGGVQQRIPSRLGPIRHGHAGKKHGDHRQPDGPAVAARTGHKSERVGERRRNGENQKKLDKICQRRGIFERMRAVGVEEAAAVRAEHLDRFLRGHRALRDDLLGDGLRGGLAVGARHGDLLRLNQRGFVVGPEILHHSLRHKDQRHDQAYRQQHPQKAARQIHPEISDGLALAPRDAANHGDGQRDAHRGGCKVVIGKPGHLREIAHRGFAANRIASSCSW